MILLKSHLQQRTSSNTKFSRVLIPARNYLLNKQQMWQM